MVVGDGSASALIFRASKQAVGSQGVADRRWLLGSTATDAGRRSGGGSGSREGRRRTGGGGNVTAATRWCRLIWPAIDGGNRPEKAMSIMVVGDRSASALILRAGKRVVGSQGVADRRWLLGSTATDAGRRSGGGSRSREGRRRTGGEGNAAAAAARWWRLIWLVIDGGSVRVRQMCFGWW
ncbi:hypothetical protein Dimus_013776 [Dionaea muscipula]